MADNFDFAALAKSWQQQPTATELPPNSADLTQAKQRQAEQKWLMYGEWFGAAVMFIAAFWLAFNIPDWLSYLSALFLISGALSSAYVAWTVHKPILEYDNWSSGGLVQFRARACTLTLRYYLYTQLSCAALVVFAGLLWLMQWWQIAQVTPTLLVFYSLIVAPLCLAAIYHLQQKKKQKESELKQLSSLAEDFQPDAEL
ncbi:hypothetical protein [Rheinheimera tangshanensis]|uniref:Uncharacterized protein n=1 Tax=Rheinheimera tangshanensis TaxID=400153 RepID=A0A5C8LZV6_9GAMM|nr:hypothetical protein [Rheinheimera tangshanensis]TXK81725.1 hypothetical protein FU839_07445 [Rheinheimera tangshanensis]GGM55699.1 hypothetical protein GCM10010920_15200 [Rheinheimera tangshanensis]